MEDNIYHDAAQSSKENAMFVTTSKLKRRY
jgi:hypothetical protein